FIRSAVTDLRLRSDGTTSAQSGQFPGSLQELWRGRPRSLVLHQKISGNRRGRWACVRTEVKSWFRCCSPSVSVNGNAVIPTTEQPRSQYVNAARLCVKST